MRRAFFGTGLARGLFATARGGDVAKTEQISQFFSSVSQHAVKVCEDVPCTGASLVPKVWTNPKVGSRPFSSFGEQALSSEEEVCNLRSEVYARVLCVLLASLVA